MQVQNIQHYDDINWEQYLRLPGYSFSGLKGEKIEPTYGMYIGTLVHRYILQSALYNYEEADVVMPIARQLVNCVGNVLLRNSICERAITADFIYDGFSLPWRGLPDMRVPNLLTIDFKVIKGGSLRNYCEQFNYPNQLRGYMRGGTTSDGLIIAYNRTKKKTEFEFVKHDDRWWEQTILKRGKVLTA